MRNVISRSNRQLERARVAVSIEVAWPAPPVRTPGEADRAPAARGIQRLAEGAAQADPARSGGVSQATISRRLAAPSPFEASAAAA